MGSCEAVDGLALGRKRYPAAKGWVTTQVNMSV